eukprot:scaffold1618_cov196-Alexandrium_tamarense.AAC.35
MAALITTEDVLSGGGTFSSCLERAIRRPVRSAAAAAASAASSVAANKNGGANKAAFDGAIDAPSTPPNAHTQNVDFARTTMAVNDILQTPVPRPTTAPTSNNDNIIDNNDPSCQDWNAHHISYPLLDSTLSFFAERRAGLRARVRDSDGYYFNANNAASGAVDVGNSYVGGCSGGINAVLKVKEVDFNAIMDEYATRAPFANNDSDDNKNNANTTGNVMEYAGQRALGKTPPGASKQARNLKEMPKLNVGEVALNVPLGDNGGENVPSSPYLRMGGSTNDDPSNNIHNSLLKEAEIIQRLSFLERSELSAVLDSEVERAATFYRLRISELAPPREDGGTVPNFMLCGVVGNEENCGQFNFMCGDEDDRIDVPSVLGGPSSTPKLNPNSSFVEDDDELVSPSQNLPTLTFTQMGNEILELYAFITTNIIVVRQVLIRYDAFVRSLGGTPMSSWYQTTRRQKVRGRSSDYRDLLYYSKLQRLSRAYINEYKRHVELEQASGDGDGVGVGEGGERKRKRRLKELSKAFYKIVDSAEEMKKRHRMKWRQPAMNLMEEEEEEEVVAATNVAAVPTVGSLNSRTCTPTTFASAELPDTPVPSTPTGSPQVPLKPPDYSNLLPTSSNQNLDIGEDIAYQIRIFKCIQSKTQRSIEKSYNGYISGFWDNAVATMRDYFLLGSVSDNLSLMPEFLIMRGKSLKSNLLVVAQWREARNAWRYGLIDLPLEQKVQQKQQPFNEWFGGFCGESRDEKNTFKTSFGLSLNILGCFFYMMNYYIVEPSSTRYANALGQGDAMSGLIIGAMPWAALFSAIIYSIWSNRCYRSPLLTSGILLVLGNLLYATAYQYNSIEMALCGRFMTGLGGPRSMNRRYIADTTPLARRTAVNAAFGTATALGAALGPGTAILLDRLDLQFNLPVYGTVYLNGLTGPGYLMALLWMIYVITLSLAFQEPERAGLEEQRQKEISEESTPAITPRSEYEMANIDSSSAIRWNPREPATPKLDKFDCVSEQGLCDSEGLCIGSEPHVSSDDDAPKDDGQDASMWSQAMFVLNHLTLPVRICLFLLFSKMFTVESVISAASMVTKNRYGWAVQQVGTLGTIVGCLTIPISIFIGWISQYREDRVLMIWLMSFAALGMGLLVDVTDFVSTETDTFNEGSALAVGPRRYIAGYLLVFCSVQAFDGVVGSVLSKVIPTALATGTLNSGLLATVVGTVSFD